METQSTDVENDFRDGLRHTWVEVNRNYTLVAYPACQNLAHNNRDMVLEVEMEETRFLKQV